MTNDILQFGYLMERCMRTMISRLSDNLASAGIALPYSQYEVMRVLYRDGNRSQIHIAHALQKDAAAIKRSIDSLESKGFVNRREVSGRENIVELIPKGESIKTTVIGIAEQTINDILAPISTEHRRIVMDTLEAICHQK